MLSSGNKRYYIIHEKTLYSLSTKIRTYVIMLQEILISTPNHGMVILRHLKIGSNKILTILYGKNNNCDYEVFGFES